LRVSVGVVTPRKPRAADRRGLRYPSDLTDAEWALVAPLIRPAKHGGRPRTVDVREVLNAVFYVLSAGCQWSALPKDLPPKSTVHDYLELWNWDGTLERIHHALYVAVREQQGRRDRSRLGEHLGSHVERHEDAIDGPLRITDLQARTVPRRRVGGRVERLDEVQPGRHSVGHAATPVGCSSLPSLTPTLRA
jgi:transposase